MRIIVFCSVCMMLLASSCSLKCAVWSTKEQGRITEEISARMAELIESANQMKIDALVKYLTENPDANFYMNAKAMGKQELLAEVLKMYIPFQSQQITVKNQRVIVLGPDAALWKAQVQSTALGKDGKSSTMDLTETWLWQKQNGEWVVTHYDESW